MSITSSGGGLSSQTLEIEVSLLEQQLEREEEDDMRKTIAFLEAKTLEYEHEMEDEWDMGRTLDLLSNAAVLHEEQCITWEEEDMAKTVHILARFGNRVGFADDLQVWEVDDDKFSRRARRGKWKPGPAEDELWNGSTFRDVELTPEELEEILSRKQYRATRILKGLFWANRKVDIEGKTHATRIVSEEGEEEEEEGEEGDNGPTPTPSPPLVPSPPPLVPPPPPTATKRKVRIPSVFLRKSSASQL
ncbi:hypothetical protein BASA81_015165 [Batrachochytrium salamandrivorans]|nr:hypothetical protein BASA81_015165 [Batrachochytrium salamandrivorans]